MTETGAIEALVRRDRLVAFAGLLALVGLAWGRYRSAGQAKNQAA